MSRWGSKTSGISRFEVLVSLFIVGIIAALLMDRLAYYEELAEKTAMESMVKQLEGGLRIKAAELIIAKRYEELANLDRVNPFTLLEGAPGNYVGEGDNGAAAFKPGGWRYDAAAGELFYRPTSRRHLLLIGSGAENAGELRFRSRLVRSDPGGDIITVALEAQTRYRWFD